MSVVGKAGLGSQFKLLEAAKAAGVKRFLPAEYGFELEKIGWV